MHTEKLQMRRFSGDSGYSVNVMRLVYCHGSIYVHLQGLSSLAMGLTLDFII